MMTAHAFGRRNRLLPYILESEVLPVYLMDLTLTCIDINRYLIGNRGNNRPTPCRHNTNYTSIIDKGCVTQ